MQNRSRESQRQEILQRARTHITEFETQLLGKGYTLAHIRLTLVFVCVERMKSRTKKGLVYADPLEKSANEFFEQDVEPMLREFTGENEAEFLALEAKVHKHLSDTIDGMYSGVLLGQDAVQQKSALV
ncbi:MAG: hypothetical protein HYW65_01420 [Candidatus Liptonbacteria bacterium]|nr:hypothetical protein [Candidatus Liptonbacteria bacterium]